jgi:hypothetical protein
MAIITEYPESLEEETQRPALFNRSDFPFVQMNDRTFERLVYWIFRQEIANGSWKEEYDHIELMAGIRDGGKDSSLYCNNRLTGVIQCKHSNRNSALTLGLFAEEIIKFGLYCHIYSSDMPIKDRLNYYIVSSCSFKQDCADLIANFHSQFLEHSNLGKWIRKVIKANAALKNLTPSLVEPHLKEILSKFSVIKIDSEALNRYLQNNWQYPTVRAFFTVEKVIDPQGLDPLIHIIKSLASKVDNLANTEQMDAGQVLNAFHDASYPLLNWKSFIDEHKKIHIKRTQVQETINWINTPLPKDQEPVAVLSGDAGAGKTVVLKDLCLDLIKNNIPVIGIKADKFYAEDIIDLEAQLDIRIPLLNAIGVLQKSNKRTVVIIDQLDALSQTLATNRKYLNTYNLLIKKLQRVENVRIICSVRKFDLQYDPELSQLASRSFKTIALSLLTEPELKSVLKDLNISINHLSARLLSTLSVPNHLQVFAGIYNERLSLQGIHDLHDLYDELWKQKISTVNSANGITAEECEELISRIANTMHEEQQISLKQSLLSVKENKVGQYLASNSILVYGAKEVQFFHQTFYDYAYARHFVNNNGNLITYLEQNQQSLHIRSSMKMILAYLRQSNEKLYMELIHSIVFSSSIRFHLKLLTINVLGFNHAPSVKEQDFARRLLMHKQFKVCFLESCRGDVWMSFLIQEGVLDELIFSKPPLLRVSRVIKTLKKYKLFNRIPAKFLPPAPLTDYEGRINLFWSIIHNSLPESRIAISNYFREMQDFDDKEQIVIRLLHYVKTWDSKESYRLLDQYKLTAYKSNFGYDHILEDILPYDLGYALNEYESFIDHFLNSQDLRLPNFTHRVTYLFKKVIEVDQHAAFNFGLKIINKLFERTKFHYWGKLYDCNAYSLYEHSERPNDDHHLFYDESINIAERLAKANDVFFAAFLKDNMDSNSVPVIKLMLYGLIANPSGYSNQAHELIFVLYGQTKFEDDGYLEYLIRSLIKGAYSSWTDDQRHKINEMILKFKPEYELKVHTDRNGKKVHDLKNFGKQQLLYLSSIPYDLMIAQTGLKKKYLELIRKLGKRVVDRKPNSMRFSAVPPPMADGAYQFMSLESWEKSFFRYTTNNIYDDHGGLRLHAETFAKIVQDHPEKFYDFIKKLIIENKVQSDYWIGGLTGLKNAGYDPQQLLSLFTVALKIQLDEINDLYFMRLASYFIEHQIADWPLIYFFGERAIASGNSTRVSDDNPLQGGMNSVRGLAIHNLIRCSYNSNFHEYIFKTLEDIVASEIPNETKAALVYDLAALKDIDLKRTVQIFVITMQGADEKLVQTSLRSLNYLIHDSFPSFIPLLKIWINYELVQDFFGGSLMWCWIRKYKGSTALFFSILKISSKARASAQHAAYENLFDSDKNVRLKCQYVFKKLLNDHSSDVANAFNNMFLHIEDQSFENWLPFLSKYATSSVARLSPEYFLGYLLKKSGVHPKKCLQLVKNYKTYKKPNHSTGPYYQDEPIKIVLNAYNQLLNTGELKSIKKAINLFDEMLTVDYLRTTANAALTLVEN